MYFKNYYQKECFLFYNYFNFISFLKKYMRKIKKDLSCFIKRFFFLYLLYKSMFPELKEHKNILMFIRQDNVYLKEK